MLPYISKKVSKTKASVDFETEVCWRVLVKDGECLRVMSSESGLCSVAAHDECAATQSVLTSSILILFCVVNTIILFVLFGINEGVH